MSPKNGRTTDFGLMRTQNVRPVRIWIYFCPFPKPHELTSCVLSAGQIHNYIYVSCLISRFARGNTVKTVGLNKLKNKLKNQQTMTEYLGGSITQVNFHETLKMTNIWCHGGRLREREREADGEGNGRWERERSVDTEKRHSVLATVRSRLGPSCWRW